MILYDPGRFHLGFIWTFEGSSFPKASLFAVPSGLLALLFRWLLVSSSIGDEVIWAILIKDSVAWTVTIGCLSLLLSFRTNNAYSRFWEGTTLVQQMRAEWFEACNSLMAFSKTALLKDPDNENVKAKVEKFQSLLIRLVSLMHGAALRQITGGQGDEFDVLDAQAFDDESLDYLRNHCATHEINRVEVILHWVQVLITDSIADCVLIVPPPILTRAYQTLSRGMVHLHNVRKLADVPFPFPLSQLIIVLMLIQSFIMTPLLMAAVINSYAGACIATLIPVSGFWNIVFISGELEQPFGQDPNDLPLAELQFEMNNSLLMLLDDRAKRAPSLRDGALLDGKGLRASLGCRDSTTADILGFHRRRRRSIMQNTIMRTDSIVASDWRSSGPALKYSEKLARGEDDTPPEMHVPEGAEADSCSRVTFADDVCGHRDEASSASASGSDEDTRRTTCVVKAIPSRLLLPVKPCSLGPEDSDDTKKSIENHCYHRGSSVSCCSTETTEPTSGISGATLRSSVGDGEELRVASTNSGPKDDLTVEAVFTPRKTCTEPSGWASSSRSQPPSGETAPSIMASPRPWDRRRRGRSRQTRAPAAGRTAAG